MSSAFVEEVVREYFGLYLKLEAFNPGQVIFETAPSPGAAIVAV